MMTGNSIKKEDPRNFRVEKIQNKKNAGRTDAQNDFNVSVDMPGRRDQPAEYHCETCVPKSVRVFQENTFSISLS